MVAGKNSLWSKFLQPMLKPLIDEEKLKNFYQTVDWEMVNNRFSQTDFSYPDYYQSQNFHGITGGYLNPWAAISYDEINQYVLLPQEIWVRQGLIDHVQVKPKTIVDLGCGTGTSTIMLAEAFPDAGVIGLDLSPYMLFMADYKAQQQQIKLEWRQAKAEGTKLPPNSCDLVTMSLLLHETPAKISQLILQEAWRILKPGGQIIILDGNQKNIRDHSWLKEIFEEPYIQDYAAANLDIWLEKAGFADIVTSEWWWLNQISQGFKPLPVWENYSNFVPA